MFYDTKIGERCETMRTWFEREPTDCTDVAITEIITRCTRFNQTIHFAIHRVHQVHLVTKQKSPAILTDRRAWPKVNISN